MKKIFKPLSDRVLINPIEEDQVSPAGIIVPDVAKERTQLGEVVAVGSGRVLGSGKVVPLSVKCGDRVIFGKYAGTEMRWADDNLLLMKEEEILGLIKKV